MVVLHVPCDAVTLFSSGVGGMPPEPVGFPGRQAQLTFNLTHALKLILSVGLSDCLNVCIKYHSVFGCVSGVLGCASGCFGVCCLSGSLGLFGLADALSSRVFY